jgi:hypothetical protein
MPHINWPAEQPSRLWNSHVLPSGLRPASGRPPIAPPVSDSSDSSSDANVDNDAVAREYAAKVHAQWLSRPDIDIQEIESGKSWSVSNLQLDDKWVTTGHMLAQNISYATLTKTDYLFVIGDCYRKKGYKTLMCKASSLISSKRKQPISVPPATYHESLVQLAANEQDYDNTLWNGAKRRTSSKRLNECKVAIRLHLSNAGAWTCFFKQNSHCHAETAPAAPVVIPQAVAQSLVQTHTSANLSSSQAARMCAQQSTFIPRSTLRRLLMTNVDDATWGQGGQEGLLLELMNDPSVDICAQFEKRSINRIHAAVTVARLEGVWKIVDGGLQQARRNYAAMLFTLTRLKQLWVRTQDHEYVDRIAAAEVALQERLRPCVDEEENGTLKYWLHFFKYLVKFLL